MSPFPKPPTRPSVAVPLVAAQTLLGLVRTALAEAQAAANVAYCDPAVSTDQRVALAQRTVNLQFALEALDRPTRLAHAGWRQAVDEWHHSTQPSRFPRERCRECNPEVAS